MLVLMLRSILMSHASVDFFVLSFVLPCTYGYVASENQAGSDQNRQLKTIHRLTQISNAHVNLQKVRNFQFAKINKQISVQNRLQKTMCRLQKSAIAPKTNKR